MTSVNMSPVQLREMVSSITSATVNALQSTMNSMSSSFVNANFTYDGTRQSERVEEFLTTASIYKKAQGVSDSDALKTLPLVLKGDAMTWWQGEKGGIKSWNEFERRLRHAFAPLKPGYLIFQEIFSTTQTTDMLTESFVAKNRALMAQLPDPPLPEVHQLNIVYGLLNKRIREKVPRDSIKSFDDLLQAARGVEQLLAEEVSNNGAQASGGNKKTRCLYCRVMGHTVEKCRKRLKAEQQSQKRSTATDTTATQAPSPSPYTFSCYGCGSPGVVRSKCPKCKAAANSTQPKTEKMDFCALNIDTDARRRPVIGIGIYNVVGTAYIDTCAKCSVASFELYELLMKQGCEFHQKSVDVTLADGIRKKKNILTTRVPVSLCGRVVPTTFIVLPDAKDSKTLLGVGFLQDASMVLDVPQMTLHFTDRPNQIYDLREESMDGTSMATIECMSSPYTTQVDSSMAVAPKSKETYLPLDPRTGSLPPYKLIPLEEASPCKRSKPLFDGYCPQFADFIYADARDAIESAEITLSPHTKSLFPGYTADDIEIDSLSVDDINIGTVDSHQRNRLFSLLNENQSVFGPSQETTKLAEHRIDTGEHGPISVPPYRLSPPRRAVLEKEITKMLTEGVIEPCSSPWSAPVVMVPKKDGSVRICVDYRRLNAITVPDMYPMPRIDDLLHEAKPTPFMSTLDLRAGYWQVKVREEDQDKTAFITPSGIYRFKRMAFGLRNAPATFQRLIDRVKVSVSDVKMMAYLDDLIILSISFDSHLTDLEKVLKTLKKNNLAVNLSKCRFCCSTIKYLGHYITPEGLQVDPEKVSAITELPPPTNLKHLLSFLQTCSWYRRFIENFSKISEPLTRLTKKGAVWIWGDEQKQAFDTLKRSLTSAPILRQADANKPYIIKTDASGYALGAVLVQGEGAEEHPVEYASRLLIPAERNYTTTEREALAVVWALTKFRGYIEGVPVTVVTDHQALKWLMSLKTSTGRLARWALLIQSFDITVKYMPGRTNVVADALSRPTCKEATTSTCGLCSVIVDMPTKSPANVRAEQLKDAHISKVIQALESEGSENAIYWSSKGYIMNNGLLYRYSSDESGEEAQLVAPQHEWANILSTYHDDPLAGHYGAEKTYQRIARRYYWKGMRRYIEAYVKNCIKCQRYKPSNLKPAGLLQTTSVNQRFETLSFDLFGPLPTSENGKNWILIVEDIATGWVELFALTAATAETCASLLIDEVFLRYGIPRRIHSDNGSQFVSAVMQQVTHCLGINQTFTPVYHPSANPVERKNRDMKTQLAMLVQDNHRSWEDKLPYIRFAMNTATSQVTGYTPAFLTFARELRTPDDNTHDFRQIIMSENFIPEITPKLLSLANVLEKARERRESQEEQRKNYADKKRRPDPKYNSGDLVLAKVNAVSKAGQGVSAKFLPRHDGPYIIKTALGAATYALAKPEDPETQIGVFHTSAITPYHGNSSCLPSPVQPIRKRGRPKKVAPVEEIKVTRRRGRPRKNKA